MQGVWTALVTPFNPKNELDLPAYKRILQDQKKAGVSGVIPCGTTGESPTLSLIEKKKLIQIALEELEGSNVKVVAGTGTNDTETTKEFSKWASDQGVAGVLLVTPYYNKPSQAGLIQHYRSVADQIDCEIILYNVPGRTGVSLTAETVSTLAAHPKIRTLKEATGNIPFASEILDQLAADHRELDLLSGDDATYLALLCIGARGVISVASNLFPRVMVAIFDAVNRNSLEEARLIHRKYSPLFRDLFIESNPVPLKAAMSYAGWCSADVRSPLSALSKGNAEKLRQSLEQCGVSHGALL